MAAVFTIVFTVASSCKIVGININYLNNVYLKGKINVKNKKNWKLIQSFAFFQGLITRRFTLLPEMPKAKAKTTKKMIIYVKQWFTRHWTIGNEAHWSLRDGKQTRRALWLPSLLGTVQGREPRMNVTIYV